MTKKKFNRVYLLSGKHGILVPTFKTIFDCVYEARQHLKTPIFGDTVLEVWKLENDICVSCGCVGKTSLSTRIKELIKEENL